ncbi:hypothetical protein EUX98_g3504 [Antrodiella citrinella]|uniref:Prokaryotic-type class I peptide chain release factors domain-containing protein n=1 Tax=Antrodiella citrinella TaxID=2447956 RepID=A0A4V3XIW2_9APHY|nr:hypothetical protein EUX98_g3504 [Antrodiella citrinella]
MEDEIVVIEKKLQDATAWDDAPTALKDSARLGDLRKKLSTYRELADINTGMHELAVLAQESDTQMQGELVSELEALHTRASQYLVTLWLSEPTDLNSAYIDVRSGSGGTEACDFALMLARMYTKWGHSRGFTVQTVDESPGDVAGIKSATLLLIGPYAYGYAQYESGVHRLVRISPFDSAGARHTSFASVRVSPHFDESSDDVGIELNASDLKITTMRSQGAGGQHVNKVESAVRITHIPSGITVTCQQERSQHRNRAVAMSLLRSRLYEVEMRKRAQTKADVHNILPGIGWSSQIRSYVLHPYQLIKDMAIWEGE